MIPKLAIVTFIIICASFSASQAQDSLPPLHSIKETDIKLVSKSFEDQTITVVLNNEAIYTYHRIDWDYEDHYPSTPKGIKEAIRGIKMIFTKTEQEAEFAGGQDAWNKYIKEFCEKHADHIRSEGSAKMVVMFIVHMKGQVEQLQVIGNTSNSNLDKLAMQAIMEAPDWNPAVQNGRKVVAYKKQLVQLSVD